MGYSLSCISAIHAHHRGEEEFIFPFLQTKLDMAHNLEQHEEFHAGMDTFEDYLKKVQSKQQEYDAEKMRELLKAFADPLVQHLHDEVC
jgi:hemerythrin-like domain-containing protein